MITPAVLVFLLCKRHTSRTPPPPVYFPKCTYNACSLLFNLFSSPSHGWILRATHCISVFVWVVLTQYPLRLMIVRPSTVWAWKRRNGHISDASIILIMCRFYDCIDVSISKKFLRGGKSVVAGSFQNTKQQTAADPRLLRSKEYVWTSSLTSCWIISSDCLRQKCLSLP